jgi:hypothetical protein
MTTPEFKFITYCVSHEKFGLEVSTKILEMLAYIYVNRPFVARLAAVPMIKLIQVFMTDPAIKESVMKNIVPQSLAKILGIKKEE